MNHGSLHDFYLGNVLIGHADLGVDRSMGIMAGDFRAAEGYAQIQPFFQAFRAILDGDHAAASENFRGKTVDEMRREWENLDLRCFESASKQRLPVKWIAIDDYGYHLLDDAQEVTLHVDDYDYWKAYDSRLAESA